MNENYKYLVLYFDRDWTAVHKGDSKSMPDAHWLSDLADYSDADSLK